MPEAFINLSALIRNAEKCKKFSRLCAVVKADAYGLGADRIATELGEIADMFAVATQAEAERLVACGVKKDILILGRSLYGSAARNIIHTVSSAEEIERLGFRPRVAIKVNTGMNRYGADPSEVPALLSSAREKAEISSIYSHLRDSSDKELSAKQLSVFKSVTDGTGIPRHISATGGISLGRDYALDFVRAGVGLYGGTKGFENVITVTAPVLEVRNVAAGEGFGYGNALLNKPARVAVIEIGYADGYRRLSAPRYLLINGKLRRVLAVCMDVCFAEGDDVTKGDVAEIIGNGITLENLAKSYGTITYEVLTGLGKRVIRRYG